MQKKKLILFFFLGVFSVAALGEPLTWEQCVKEAAEKNPDVGSAASGLKAAEAQYGGAYSGFFPQLSGNLGVTESNGPTSPNGTGGAIVTGGTTGASQTNYSAGVTATQSVFNGFLDVGKVRQGKANLEAARAALALAKSTLSSNLKSAFAQLLYQQELTDLNAIILKRQQANLRMITLRFEGGQENKGNLLYQAATVSQAKYGYERAVRQTKVAVRQLAALLGRPENASIEAKGELAAKGPAGAVDFHALALHHPGHDQAYYQQLAADAAVDIADAGWYPTVGLNGFVGKTGNAFPPDGNRWSVGATLSIPIFEGFSVVRGVESAHALEMQAEFNVKSTDDKVIAALEQTYQSLIDAIESVRVADEFQSAAKARSTIATEKYNTGLMTFEDWSVIETDLITREQNLLQNRLNALQAQATWENAEGTGDIP